MLLSALLLCVFLAALVAGYLHVTDATPMAWLVVGGAFLARVGFTVLNARLGLLRPADESGYRAALRFVARQWRDGVVHAPLTVSGGPGHDGLFIEVYTLVLGPIYTVFGGHAVLARLGIAFFGTLVVANIYLIGHQLYSRRAGVYAAAIAAAFPYWIYLSGILYRDMLVVFFFTTMIYGVIRWQRDSGDRLALVLAIGGGVFAIGLRKVNIIAVGAMVGMMLYTRVDRRRRAVVWMAAASIGAGLIMVALFGDEISVAELADRRLWLARPASGSYLTGYTYASLLELVVFAPIGALYFTFVPFPWQTPNLLAQIAVVQNLLLWYPVAILAVIGVRDVLHTTHGRHRLLPPLAFALVGIGVYGLVEGNIGPAMRHRTQFQFVAVAFAGVALSNRLAFSTGLSRVFGTETSSRRTKPVRRRAVKTSQVDRSGKDSDSKPIERPDSR